MLVHIARNLFSSIVMYNSSINFSRYVSNFRSNGEKISCSQFTFCILICCICEVTFFNSLRMTQLEVKNPAGWLLKKHKLATWTNLPWKVSKNTVIYRNKTPLAIDFVRKGVLFPHFSFSRDISSRSNVIEKRQKRTL